MRAHTLKSEERMWWMILGLAVFDIHMNEELMEMLDQDLFD